MGYWVDTPPVHVSVSSYMKAMAGAQAPFPSMQGPREIDWTSDYTSAPKPTESELAGFLDRIHR